MRRTFVCVAVGLLSLSGATIAHAAPPAPRGPIGGCGAGFQLTSVAEISERFPLGAPVFAREDSNLDGQVCVRLSPPQQGEGGVVEDNNAVGRR
jgi:hypothetical protein